MAADEVVRVMTNDGSFRVIVVDVSETAREIVRSQQLTNESGSVLAELVAGMVLVRETMAPWLRVQGLVSGQNGRGRLSVDAYPDGGNRGWVQSVQNGFSLGTGSILQVIRELPNRKTHQGTVDVSSCADMSHALMVYLQSSEQITSVVAVSSKMHQGEISRCGGYLVQLLPEAKTGSHAIMTERLADFPSMTDWFERPDYSVQLLIQELTFGMEHTSLGQAELRYYCPCNEERVLTSLASMGTEEIRQIVDQGEVLDIECAYCKKKYVIAPSKLRSLTVAN